MRGQHRCHLTKFCFSSIHEMTKCHLRHSLLGLRRLARAKGFNQAKKMTRFPKSTDSSAAHSFPAGITSALFERNFSRKNSPEIMLEQSTSLRGEIRGAASRFHAHDTTGGTVQPLYGPPYSIGSGDGLTRYSTKLLVELVALAMLVSKTRISANSPALNRSKKRNGTADSTTGVGRSTCLRCSTCPICCKTLIRAGGFPSTREWFCAGRDESHQLSFSTNRPTAWTRPGARRCSIWPATWPTARI